MRYLPTYGAVQASMSAAFSDASAVRGIVIQCLWLIGAATAGFLVFRRRTRNALDTPVTWEGGDRSVAVGR